MVEIFMQGLIFVLKLTYGEEMGSTLLDVIKHRKSAE
jgi:hypothetical protein